MKIIAQLKNGLFCDVFKINTINQTATVCLKEDYASYTERVPLSEIKLLITDENGDYTHYPMEEID